MDGLSNFEQGILEQIKYKTNKGNLDNISRTMFYQNYYVSNKEIWWALLASMVSRNAGWNMTDLESNWYKRMLSKPYRKTLLQTYERANWLIFEDAFPQLLLYEISKKINQPLFYLLEYFHVSKFMQKEWERFFIHGEIERLCTALIINEQNLIQKPVIEHPFYSSQVFQTTLYSIQEHLHFSNVIFPTLEGRLYGISIKKFVEVRERIKLGKQLMLLLFKYPQSLHIREFAMKADYTGSRKDYEKFVEWKVDKKTPMLRTIYPIIYHHRHDFSDWSYEVECTKTYFEEVELPYKVDITEWYKHKLAELYVGMRLEEWLLPKEKTL